MRIECYFRRLGPVTITGCLLVAVFSSCYTDRVAKALPSVTPIPDTKVNRPVQEMPVPNPTKTPEPENAPISVQSSGSAESKAVNDLKTDVNTNVNTAGDPQEINQQNRFPIKKIVTNTNTNKAGVVSTPGKKNKTTRHKPVD